jgi:hypothetical protein
MLNPRFNQLVWLSIAVIYIAFVAWYGGNDRPLSDGEIDILLGNVEMVHSGDPEMMYRIRSFAEEDDGLDFWVINLLETSSIDPQNLFKPRMGRPMFRLLLTHGGHPVFAAGGGSPLLGSDSWDQVSAVRYRSRRDLLEIMASSVFWSHIEINGNMFDDASKTIVAPGVGLFAGPRLLVLLILLMLGGLICFVNARFRILY